MLTVVPYSNVYMSGVMPLGSMHLKFPATEGNGLRLTCSGHGTFGSCFDPEADCGVRYRRKPHWTQASAFVFVTFRLADSIPRVVFLDWERAREDWLAGHGYRRGTAISESIAALAEELGIEF